MSVGLSTVLMLALRLHRNSLSNMKFVFTQIFDMIRMCLIVILCIRSRHNIEDLLSIYTIFHCSL